MKLFWHRVTCHWPCVTGSLIRLWQQWQFPWRSLSHCQNTPDSTGRTVGATSSCSSTGLIISLFPPSFPSSYRVSGARKIHVLPDICDIYCLYSIFSSGLQAWTATGGCVFVKHFWLARREGIIYYFLKIVALCFVLRLAICLLSAPSCPYHPRPYCLSAPTRFEATIKPAREVSYQAGRKRHRADWVSSFSWVD